MSRKAADKARTPPALPGQTFGICALLAALTWAVFGQTLGHEFVNYDDNTYIYENPVVQEGLTFEGLRWAFTYGEIGHWHPLTWLSHMLDCELFGLAPWGHHLVNVLLHAAAILLFLVLREMTRGSQLRSSSSSQLSTINHQLFAPSWPSAFVAAVFAIHPLRAESVAWIAERKDVLAAFFFMLTLGAYVCYVRRPSTLRYLAVFVLFALGLLSKNMLVTLPFVLLLLDYWPLGRMSGGAQASRLAPLRGLILEKLPLFALTIASCTATFLVPEEVAESDRLPFPLRLQNALVSYAAYLGQSFWPVNLAIPYPNPINGIPLWQVALSLTLLAALTATVLAFRKSRPYLLVGWFWYLGMLVPVIGLVQISNYARADRYTYLPQIGLLIALTWLIADLSASWRHRRWILSAAATAAIVALAVAARFQTARWRNSESLWTHALRCTSDNHVAHGDLGAALFQKGQIDQAIAHFREALRINPHSAKAHNNLGNAFLSLGRTDEAILHFKKASELSPNMASARYNLGNAYLQTGNAREAIASYQRAIELNLAYADAWTISGLFISKTETFPTPSFITRKRWKSIHATCLPSTTSLRSWRLGQTRRCETDREPSNSPRKRTGSQAAGIPWSAGRSPQPTLRQAATRMRHGLPKPRLPPHAPPARTRSPRRSRCTCSFIDPASPSTKVLPEPNPLGRAACLAQR